MRARFQAHNRFHTATPCLLGVCLSLAATLLACSTRAQAEPEQLPLVRICQAGQEGSRELALRGSVASEGRLKLGFKASGILSSLPVREGDAVRAGQTLATLDGIDAASQAQSAKAALDLARREWVRAERLAAEGILPAVEREDARSRLDSAMAAHRSAQDAVIRTRLAAPVGGTIFQRLAEPGEAVVAGTPVLVLDTTGRPVVRAGVTERDISRLRPGQSVALLPEDGTAPFKGRVRSLGAAPSSSDGLYPVEVLPERTDLRPGTLLTLRFKGLEGLGGLRIPFQALVHRQDRDYVFVVNGTAPDFKVEARPVEVAETDGIRIVLRKGLKAGERVVAEGAFFLEDGQAVRILE